LKLRLSPFIFPHLALVHIYHGFATAIFSSVAMAAVVNTFDSDKDLKNSITIGIGQACQKIANF